MILTISDNVFSQWRCLFLVCSFLLSDKLQSFLPMFFETVFPVNVNVNIHWHVCGCEPNWIVFHFQKFLVHDNAKLTSIIQMLFLTDKT